MKSERQIISSDVMNVKEYIYSDQYWKSSNINGGSIVEFGSQKSPKNVVSFLSRNHIHV